MMIADNFQKSGKFILGIKLGNDTEKHISTVLYRINCLGGPISLQQKFRPVWH